MHRFLHPGLRWTVAMVALFWLACGQAATAQDAARPPFVGVWIDAKATLADDAIQAAVDDMASREADPQHIVVYIHGFATSRADSTAQYTRVGAEALKAFQERGQRAVVLGIQWDSDVGPVGDWLPSVIGGAFGIGRKDNPYMKKVHLAVDVGRVGARQVLLKLQERFPRANISVLAHSLGSQVTFAALEPLEKNLKNPKGTLEPFRPEVPLHLNVICLAGADVDYDAVYRSNTQIRQRGVADLFWLTLAGRGAYQPVDAVLAFRTLLRGDQALGNRFPRLSVQQIDGLCKNRRLVLDTIDIPPKHEFLKYYDRKRIGRLADVAVALHDPSRPSKVLQQLEQVIAAPADPKTLVEFFRNLDPTVQYYTLWRLENIFCGQASHLASGYLEHFANDFQDRPDQLDNERFRSPCEVVRRGIWPTVRMMQAVMDRKPGAKVPQTTSGFDMP